MAFRRSAALTLVLAFGFLVASQGALAQTTYVLKVATDAPSYTVGQTIKVTGSVTPAPGPSTGVTLKIINPSGAVLAVGEAAVAATSGLYNYTFVAGGSSSWTTGTYEVNATWGAYPPQIYAQATFTYASAVTTTTTTTTATTTSHSSTTTTTKTTTTTTTALPSSTTTTRSSSSGGGGIPVFPYAGALTILFVGLVLSAYLAARKFAVRRPAITR